MAAGGKKQAIGKVDAVGEPRRERMGLEMIDGDERLVVRQRNGLGCRQSDNDAADQARPSRGRDAVQRAERHLRLGHRLADDPVERLDMGARGDLRDDAAELGMFADLR